MLSQKTVLEGIKVAQDAISCMEDAIVNDDAELSSDIEDATNAVGDLRDGALAVIAAQNKSLADLGLEELFDAKPNCADIAAGRNNINAGNNDNNDNNNAAALQQARDDVVQGLNDTIVSLNHSV